MYEATSHHASNPTFGRARGEVDALMTPVQVVEYLADDEVDGNERVLHARQASTAYPPYFSLRDPPSPAIRRPLASGPRAPARRPLGRCWPPEQQWPGRPAAVSVR